jgi:hypothetical protein
MEGSMPAPKAGLAAVIELRCGRVHAESGARCKGRFNSYALNDDGSSFGTTPLTVTSQGSRAPLPTRRVLGPAEDPDHLRAVNLGERPVRRRTARCPRCPANYVLTERLISEGIRRAAAQGKRVVYLADLS